jgi:hypothetical protein
MKTIADYPGYTITEADASHDYKSGEIFAMPFQTRDHGTLHHFFTFGCVTDYALQYKEDPDLATAKALANGHDLFWANLNGVCITAERHAKESFPQHTLGEIVSFKGHLFTITRDGFAGHIKLIEVQ